MLDRRFDIPCRLCAHSRSLPGPDASTHSGFGPQLASTDAAGVWTVQAGVFPENVGSLALHAAAGFRTIGVRERLGRHHGRWRDVVLLERRSPYVG